MKTIAMVVVCACLLTGTAWRLAAEETPKAPEPALQQMPKMPEPVKEHEWLKQLTGEWESDVSISMPGQPEQKSQGTESGREVGGFWIVTEMKGTFQGKPFTGIQTLGYDPEKQKYVGTWVDNMTGYLWQYEGELDETGKILTLHTEGPCPTKPGELSKFKEVLEFKDKDHKVYTSYVQDENGQWVKGMEAHSRRK